MGLWSLPSNVQAWLQDGAQVYDESICRAEAGTCTPWFSVSTGHAAAYLGTLLMVAVVASMVSFRRRDVP
jgi:hypothetical protein